MSDEPDTPWKFIAIEDFLGDVDKDPSLMVMNCEVGRLRHLHKCSSEALLRRCILLLRIVATTMPADATNGLDAVRADPHKKIALHSLRDMITFLLAPLPEHD